MRTIAVNLTGTWLCSQAVVPFMKQAGSGKIINISATMAASGGPPGWAPYTAAKAGIVGLTRALGKELAPHGINVNAIAPGMIPPDASDMTADQRARFQPFIDTFLPNQPIKRLGNPVDIAAAIEFLLSDDASFVAGQVWTIDGGVVVA